MNHLSYDTSVKLARFLGDSAPIPIGSAGSSYWTWFRNGRKWDPWFKVNDGRIKQYPIYTLEDILSRPFCEAIAYRIKKKPLSKMKLDNASLLIHIGCSQAYWQNGFPAVEAEILRLIKEK